MLSKFLVQFWMWWYGKLHMPGLGWVIRRLRRFIPGLRAYPLEVPGVGLALLDFSDTAAFGMIRLFELGDFGNDASLFRLLEKLLTPGSVLWDVGANVGFVSGYFAQPRFQISAIHAFEPNPRPRATLMSLFQNCPRVHVHPFGLGSRNETKLMNASLTDSLVGSISKRAPGGQQIQIYLRRCDSLLDASEVQWPDIIKIDVEGFEPEVFAGLQKTILTGRPIIIFEHIWLSNDQVQQCVPENYSLLFLHDDGEIAADFSERRKGHDAILVPREKMAALQGCSRV